MVGKIFESLPLFIFLTTMRMVPASYDDRWLIIYGASAVAAVACILFKIVRREFQNKLFLGINLYVISGAMAVVTQQYGLLQLYGSLQSAAMLLWVAGTGLYALVASRWFPKELRDEEHAKAYGKVMTILCLGAFFLAFRHVGNQLLAEIIPFLVLFVAYYQLTYRLRGQQAA